MITAGEVLKKKRNSLGRTLDVASQETKIQERFLSYIEHNEFDKFDSEVFLTGFIKIYSQYLGLDTEKVLALYRRSVPRNKTKKKQEKVPSISKLKKFIFTPKALVTTLSALFFLIVFGYIGLQIYKFQSPPTLIINTPINESTTEQPTVAVQGNTQPGVILEINSSIVNVDSSGNFSQEITLNEGINIITVKARKNSNNILEATEVRKITYTKPATEQISQPAVKTFQLKIEVNGASSWVKLDVDGSNKVAKVVEPSTMEYSLTNQFYIITGRAANTKVYVNDELITWKTNNSTGVAEITCNISNQSLVCE